MCVAELNVSLSPCRHRWYRLLRPCAPNMNLSNCPSKLGIEGWETKCDFCPYCIGAPDLSTYRLVGNDRSPSIGGLSRSPSLSMSLSSTRRDSRRGSLARSDSSTSATGVMLAAGEKNRALNARLDAYLASCPEKTIRAEGEDPDAQPPSPVSDGENGQVSVAQKDASGSRFGKSWKKGKRFSKGFFKGG